MANEFYARKGLAIGTASLDTSGTTPRVLVLDSNNVVKYRNNITGGSSVTAAAPTFSVQISDGVGLTGFGVIDYNRANFSLNRPGYLITSQLSCNTFIGASAGVSSTNTANGNVFVGYKSGFCNTSGNFNSFLGTEAGALVTQGACNTLIGHSTGGQLTTQCKNTFIGTEAGKSALSTDSVLIGFQAGCGNNINSSSNNVMIGNCAGFTNTTGANNTFVGIASGCKNTDGARNVYIGAEAGCNSCGAQDNVFVGHQAGKVVTQTSATSTFNTFIGVFSGVKTTSGLRNTFIGSCTGYENTTQSDNVFIGSSAGLKATANCNTIIGACAGSACTMTGTSSVFVGYQAGLNNNSGYCNTFVGIMTGCNNTTGNFNTFVGAAAGSNNATGFSNVFIGNWAGRDISGCSANVFIGHSSSSFNTTSRCGISIGALSDAGDALNVSIGYSAGAGSTGCCNVLLGAYSGNNGEWFESVIIGQNTGQSGNGCRNVVIGSRSFGPGTSVVTYNNTIAIGYCAIATTNNQLVLASTHSWIGTASTGTFNQFLCARINGTDFKIPLYT